ncbi:MAG: TIGR02117 family protein [Bacteroidota bacterium]
MDKIRKIGQFILVILGGGLILYGLGIVLGMLIPRHTRFQPTKAEEGIEIFVYTNGFHSYLILPVQTPSRDWQSHFPLQDFTAVDSSFSHISLGWGDKAFFVDTPTWEDFSWSTSLAALFLPTPSALQVSYLAHPPAEGKTCKAVTISKKAYGELSFFVEESLNQDSLQKPQLIPGKGYTDHDNFYLAEGRYSIAYTCNTWTCEGLAKAGVRVPIWTPLDKGLFFQLNKIP